MPIQQESIKSELISKKLSRLDPTYYILKEQLKRMQKASFLKNDTLEKLGVKISSGSYVKEYVEKSFGVKYLRVGNIKPFSINESERNTEYVISDEDNKNKVKYRDVIIGRTQATTEKLAVASIIDEKADGSFISQHVTKLDSKESHISPEFLVSYLNSDFYIHQLKIASHGDTRVELTHNQIKELLIFIPEEKILKQIEHNVSRIFVLNKKANSLIEKSLDILKRNLNLSLLENKNSFTLDLKKLSDRDIWNPKCNLPNYYDLQEKLKTNHSTIQLSDQSLFEIRRGKEIGSENYKIGLDKLTGDLAFIRTSDVVNYEIDLSPDYFVNENFEELPNFAKEGDIIFSRDGVIADTAMICEDDRALIASGFYIISLKKKLNISPEYFFTCMSSFEIGKIPAYMRTVFASTIPHLQKRKKDKSELENFYIPIISNDAQENITKLIRNAFKLKSLRKKRILKNREIFNCLFKEASKVS